MAIWYCGSEKYTAVTAWAISITWAVGDIRRPTAAAVGNERVFRCTTAGLGGATEPTWVNTKAATTTDNLATWTEVTGDAAWNTPTNFAAPHARVRLAAAWMAAGDSLYVSSAHNATEAASVTITFPGTNASPNTVLSIDAATGNYLAGATESTTGLSSLFVGGSCYIEGFVFNGGSGVNTIILALGPSTTQQCKKYVNCDFILVSTSASSTIRLGGSGGTAGMVDLITLVNPRFKFASTGQYINALHTVEIFGGSIITGGSTPVSLFVLPAANTMSSYLFCTGFDFSNLAATVNIVTGGAVGRDGFFTFANCKMPTAWSGALVSTAITKAGFDVNAYNLAADDTNYRFWKETISGSIKEETSIVMTGGATDGTTSYAMKMVSSADAEYPLLPLTSQKLFKRNETTGAAKTVTVEITHSAAAALTDKEIYLELEYLGTTGFPLSLFANDGPATVLTTAVDQTTSTQAWGGAAQTYKQKLSVTVTPQEKGDFIATVKLFKASTTVYVNPDLIIT